ncbi:MAG TPA: hypothetical protein VLA55_11465 [Ornithinibacter sp.]|nr:hypothetical protein [Ornithinibacter sp.]
MSTEHAHQAPTADEITAGQGEAADASGSNAASRDDDHWLVRDPVRTGFLLVLVVSLVVRLNVLRDSYFITDDFMLMSRAVEAPFGWDYLGRVHTGHFEPVGFAVMWALSHVAPWNWGAAVAVIMIGLLIAFVLVWRLLVELFGRRGLTLVPFALFCFSPLTLPATTWLSAAIIWIPLMASVAGVTRHHVRFLRTGRRRSAVAALAWLVVGLLSFEKTLVVLPYLVVLSLAVQPHVRFIASELWRSAKATALIWAGYTVTTVAYLAIYLVSLARDEGRASLFVPSMGQVWDFTYLSVFRTLIPASVGGPWRWQPVGYGGALVDSPRFFDWLALAIAIAFVVVSLATRRRMARHWGALLTYLGFSLGILVAGRVALGGPIMALETRYLADAAVPLAVAVGAALMPLVGERNPWLPFADTVRRQWPQRSRTIAGAAGLGVILLLSLHAMNSYAAISSANPHRAFVENVRTSLATLPPDAEIFDTALPVNIVGPIFAEYDYVSRFIAPVQTPAQRAALRERTQFSNPYYLDPSGQFVPMRVEGSSSPDLMPGVCGWTATNGSVTVPLGSPAFPWSWAVRVGYLADGDTSATIRLGDASQEVTLAEGLGEVYVRLVGGGDEITLDGLDESVQLCVGDVQVGNPATR